MTQLEIYAKNVEDKASNPSDYLFHNEGNEHALIICKNIFRTADSKIRIAANQLYNDEVVNKDEYIEAMRGFLDKEGTRLHVIITTAPLRENMRREGTFYGMIFDHPAYKDGRVIIKVGDGKTFKNKKGDVVNFCTGDNRMYRFEDDIVKRTAIANFKDTNTTANLIANFDRVFDSINHVLDLQKYFV